MGTKVRDLMTPGVQSIGRGESLTAAAVKMRENDVGSIPVIDGDQLIGILTDRDIVMRAVADRVDPQTMSAGDVASHSVVTAEPDQDLDDALMLMAQHQVRRLPVVEDGQLVGMLAQADVALMAKGKKVGELLEGVSQPSSTAHE